VNSYGTTTGEIIVDVYEWDMSNYEITAKSEEDGSEWRIPPDFNTGHEPQMREVKESAEKILRQIGDEASARRKLERAVLKQLEEHFMPKAELEREQAEGDESRTKWYGFHLAQLNRAGSPPDFFLHTEFAIVFAFMTTEAPTTRTKASVLASCDKRWEASKTRLIHCDQTESHLKGELTAAVADREAAVADREAAVADREAAVEAAVVTVKADADLAVAEATAEGEAAMKAAVEAATADSVAAVEVAKAEAEAAMAAAVEAARVEGVAAVEVTSARAAELQARLAEMEEAKAEAESTMREAVAVATAEAEAERAARLEEREADAAAAAAQLASVRAALQRELEAAAMTAAAELTNAVEAAAAEQVAAVDAANANAEAAMAAAVEAAAVEAAAKAAAAKAAAVKAEKEEGDAEVAKATATAEAAVKAASARAAELEARVAGMESEQSGLKAASLEAAAAAKAKLEAVKEKGVAAVKEVKAEAEASKAAAAKAELAASARAAELEARVAGMESEQSVLKAASLEAAAAAKAKLEAAAKAAKAAKAEGEASIKMARGEVANANARAEEALAKVTVMATAINRLQQELDTAKQEVASKTNEASELRKRLDEIEKEKNTSVAAAAGQVAEAQEAEATCKSELTALKEIKTSEETTVPETEPKPVPEAVVEVAAQSSTPLNSTETSLSAIRSWGRRLCEILARQQHHTSLVRRHLYALVARLVPCFYKERTPVWEEEKGLWKQKDPNVDEKKCFLVLWANYLDTDTDIQTIDENAPQANSTQLQEYKKMYKEDVLNLFGDCIDNICTIVQNEGNVDKTGQIGQIGQIREALMNCLNILVQSILSSVNKPNAIDDIVLTALNMNWLQVSEENVSTLRGDCAQKLLSGKISPESVEQRAQTLVANNLVVTAMFCDFKHIGQDQQPTAQGHVGHIEYDSSAWTYDVDRNSRRVSSFVPLDGVSQRYCDTCEPGESHPQGDVSSEPKRSSTWTYYVKSNDDGTEHVVSSCVPYKTYRNASTTQAEEHSRIVDDLLLSSLW